MRKPIPVLKLLNRKIILCGTLFQSELPEAGLHTGSLLHEWNRVLLTPILLEDTQGWTELLYE